MGILSRLLAAIGLAFFVEACDPGGPGEGAETSVAPLEEPAPSRAELEAVFGPRDPTTEMADPVMLAYCRGACVSTVEVWEAFCRVVPHPPTRAACWGTWFLGQVGCQGWCYWQYGS